MEKYRVVYSEDITDGKYFIDIMPAIANACHMDILLERQKYNPNAHDRAGSIILYDLGEGHEPKIDFLILKDNLLLSDHFEFDADLLPQIAKQIKQTYQEMRATGKDHNIEINYDDRFTIMNDMSTPSAKNNSSSEERQKEIMARQQHRQKISADKKADENNKKSVKPEVLMAWKQSYRSGD